jgi:WD40 repeat protein
MDLAFSADGQLLASASEDHTIYLWQLPEGNPLLILTGHTGAVNNVSFSSNDEYLVSGSEDGTIRIWSAIE